MPPDRATSHAVISGDLVLSESLPAAVRRAMPARLAESVAILREEAGITASDVDIFRGDAWQVIVEAPERAIEAAVVIRASLMAWQAALDTRAVIGIGRIDSRGDDRVSSGYGEAFTRSGHALDSLPRDRRMAIRFADDAVSEMMDGGVHLLDRVVSGWTPAQARAVLGALRGRSQDEIGAAWNDGPISQQAVAQHLQRASWNAVSHWLNASAAFIQHTLHPT